MEITKVWEDKRGNIYKIVFENEEWVLQETKAGYLRGGDVHQSDQHNLVLSGTIEFKEKLAFAEKCFYVNSGEKHIVGAGIPHILKSITDSLMLEWLDTYRFEHQYYMPYRQLVETQK